MNILTCAGTAKADGRPSLGRRKGWVLLGLCTLWPAVAGAQQASAVSATAVQLAPVKVQGHAEADGTTEGTNSYTSDSSNTSTRLRLAPRETPQSVSIMTRQRMDDQGLTQLTDVIVQTPGLILDGGGNMGSDSSPIYARGFQVDNYQIDGVGLNYTGYTDLAQTSDMAMFDRVEVVRGATGLMNGVGSPGATINMIRKKPTRDFQAGVKVETGSWDYYRGEADISTPFNESGSVRGRLVAAWQENRSFIDRLKERKKLFYGIVEADLTSQTLATLGFSVQDQRATGHARSGRPLFYADGGRVDWDRSDSAAADWAYSDRYYYSIFASLEHRFDNDWRVKGTLNRGVTEYDEVLGYAAGGYPDRVTGAGVNLWAGRWAGKPRQDSLDLYATGPFTLFGRTHDLVVGATATRTSEDTTNYNLWWFDDWSSAIPDIYNWDGRYPAAPNNPATGERRLREKLTSAYATTRLRATDSLSFILGGRMTSWRSDKDTLTYSSGTVSSVNRAENDKFTPYAGIVYDINHSWSAYASYTSIFKPQTNKDINGDYIEPLLGNSYEVGLKGAFLEERLNVSAALFSVKQDNLAVAIPGEFAPDGSAAYRAESGTRSRGFEIELAGELAPNWQAAASYGRTLTKDRNDDPLNTDIPQSTFKLFTTYRFPEIGRGLTVGGGLRWQSRIYADDLGPAKQRLTQKSYALVDLMARYEINKQVSAYVNMYNVFDKTYYATASPSSYYGAPRYLKAGMDIRF
ncbi:TonB-dependent siderophore receptor [Allopusillimonas ginsengisoli]|uniref:TonB-dependent siderophore receptor n=1 Tax=Allopusillimonas ginsengisoli TaxID=453575 RepID=UPI001FD68318|nr:TonB-dependent siderophore receptor [Allopusillimonas ginsengisoli]